MSRKKIDKETRNRVYEKYGGRCAYCGKEIALKNMQVDHLVPIYLGGKDDIGNYMPSCRSCNFRKATLSIDEFRKELIRQCDRLLKTFQCRQSMDYGLIERKNADIVFYFEKYK